MVTTAPPGTDGDRQLSRIRQAHERMRRRESADTVDDPVRTLVRQSWQRSLAHGAGVDSVSVTDLDDQEFRQYRAAHPMTIVRPVVQSLMLDDISDSGVVLALTDEFGRLLWIEGDSAARNRASAINFVEGSVWSEDVVGTNAPGVALTLDQCVQINGPEHFAESVQRWSCAAAPVHDPVTGHVLGVVDITGGNQVAAPFALSAVRLAVAAVERELRTRAIDLSAPAESGARLSVLDDGGYRWSRGGASRTLSRRHAEILLMLTRFREGLDTEQLAIRLAEDGVDPVTVRAEISRLRRDLGAGIIESRPYRLLADTVTDVDDLRDSIRRRHIGDAIRAFGRGGLLSASTAPGVIEIFEEIREDLRAAALTSADECALRRWTSSPHGRDDLAAWRRLGAVLPDSHPDRVLVASRIRVLDRRFGI